MKAFSFLLLLPLAGEALAQSSANYSNSGTLSSGGGRSSGGVYSQTAAFGTLAGATSTSAVAVARHGFIGQLYEVMDVHFTPATGSAAEVASFQLAPLAGLDDGTVIAAKQLFGYTANPSGPATVNATGLVTTSVVAASTGTVLTASFGGKSGNFTLTVNDTIPDNYRGYAADGVPDSWQLTHWGPIGMNPQAGPNMDPDGDGQTNSFEYLAGTSPLDRLSRFWVNVARESVGSAMKVSYGPLNVGSQYQVYYNDGLSGAWQLLTGSSPEEAGGVRTEHDPGSAAKRKRFYKVEVTRP